ncbi:MAG: hypothetical protein RIS47_2278 [Bacteroidota bacterium]|jgi:hypothetical protein
MKSTFVILFLALFTSQLGFSQTTGEATKEGSKASIEWIKLEHDLGEIPQNKPITVKFSFKNAGLVPVIITNVESSCGCTVPDYPRSPIKYGQTAEISATYDAKNLGAFFKTIKVFTNAGGKAEELKLKGIVIK